jgi:hypothetical protein
MHYSLRLVVPVILSLAACGKGDTAGAKTDNDESIVRVPASTGKAATTIHLTIEGGPHAGTYDAESDDITCTYGFAGPGTWGNQYTALGKSPKEFSSLQLIVDAKDAADGTDAFLMTVAFGEMMKPGYSEHVIDTQTKNGNRKGTGTIRVDDQKTGGKVTFKGVAEDGARLEGTIDCHQMMRSES